MLDAIKKRRSIRSYQLKEVEEEKVKEVLTAAMASPSAHNERPWEFVVVKDQKTRDALAKVKEWSYFANQAPIVIVLCSKETSFWVENLSMVAENIYLEATNQGLGTCFMQIRESITTDGKDVGEVVRTILSIPASILILGMMTLGYPAETKAEHAASEFEEKKIHRQTW